MVRRREMGRERERGRECDEGRVSVVRLDG